LALDSRQLFLGLAVLPSFDWSGFMWVHKSRVLHWYLNDFGSVPPYLSGRHCGFFHSYCYDAVDMCINSPDTNMLLVVDNLK
jgi:hypothetical protein